MGGGHKAPRKAPQTLQEEAGQHTKDENTDKRFRDGDLSLVRELRRRIFHIVGNTLTGMSMGSFGISEGNIQFRSVAQSCPTLCDPMNRSTPGLPVRHQLPEFTETHVHRVSDAIQPSHPLSSPSPPAPNPSQHQGLFQRVNSSHEVAKVLAFPLQHQSFQ